MLIFIKVRKRRRFKSKSLKTFNLLPDVFLLVNAALGIAAKILFVLYKKIEAESPPILLQELERPDKQLKSVNNPHTHISMLRQELSTG